MNKALHAYGVHAWPSFHYLLTCLTPHGWQNLEGDIASLPATEDELLQVKAASNGHHAMQDIDPCKTLIH